MPTGPPPERGYLPLGHDISPGYGGGNHGAYNGGYNQTPPPGLPSNGQNGQPYPTEKHQTKDKGHGGMMAGAAGGLAVGAVGGALINHAMGTYSAPRDGECVHQQRGGVRTKYLAC